MIIKLFEVRNKAVVATEHCYTITWLKAIIDEYSEDEEYNKIFAYIFYMCCSRPDENPFFHLPEHLKESRIVKSVDLGASLEDPLILTALKKSKELYETPTSRAYKGIKQMLDNLAEYMASAEIKDGKDGNLTALVNAAAKFDSVRKSFKDTFKDFEDEQTSNVRGGKNLSYDQR